MENFIHSLLKSLLPLAGTSLLWIGSISLVLAQGEPASEAPWMVALLHDKDQPPAREHFSGGILIHPYWVLTAAHSVDNKTALDLEILCGAQSFDPAQAETWRRVAVERILIQPGYLFRDGLNDADLALLRLKEPVHDFAPANLLDNDDVLVPGHPIHVLGWRSDRGSARLLSSIKLRVIDRENAESIAALDSTRLHQDALPVLSENGEEGICYGDSGGPLMVATEDGPRVAAVSSYVVGDCGGLGIGANLNRYIEWIQSIINPEFTEWSRKRQLAIRPGANEDRDGLTQYEEFALGTYPPQMEPRGLKALLRKNGVKYELLHSPDLKEWTPLADIEQRILELKSFNPEYNEVIIDAENPLLTNANFIRLTAQPAATAGSIPILHASSFHLKGQAEWSLDPQTQKLMQIYRFTGLRAGITRFTFISPFFDPYLEVIERETGEVLLSAGDSGNIWLEADLHTHPDVDYEIHLSSISSNTAGRFEFYFPSLPSTANILQTGPTVESQLTTQSDHDGSFYSRAYALRGAATGDVVEITMTSDPAKGGFHPSLWVYDNNNLVVRSPDVLVDSTSVSVTLKPGSTYYVFATTVELNKVGPFTLSAAKQ